MRTLTHIALMGVLLVIPTLASAAFDDATLTTDTVLTVGGITLNVSGPSAVIESITVDSSSFSFALRSGSVIQVTSPDKKVLSSDASNQFILTNTCGSSESVLKHGGYTGSGTITVTVTPSSSTCGGASASSASGGGGGIVPSCNTGYTLSGGFCIPVSVGSSVASAGPRPSVSSPQPEIATGTVSAVFTKPLRYGMRSDDVRRLQQLLTRDVDVYPEGLVTGFFGPATKRAVQRFQIKYNVVSSSRDAGYGAVGPKTRATLKDVYK